MPQKYKVFFNNNKLYIAKQQLSGINFYETFKNPGRDALKEIVFILFNGSGQKDYLIVTTDLERTWSEFKSFFQVRKAAGGIVVNSNNEKLFIKRRGFWDLPKGHLEKNEKNSEAALREVSEECGIGSLKIERKLLKTYHTYVLKNKIVLKPTKWYLMTYHGNAKPKPQTKEAITEAVWAGPGLEQEFAENTYLSIIEVVEKANSLNFSFAPEAV